MFGCFPSNHCTCSLLLMYAFIDFGFFNQKHDVKSKRFIAKCILIPLFSVYSLCVCFSTMTLKIHYFVDFCAALGICTF
ncbi:MAG: phosphatase PAP2 family protein [Mycoplasmoidaceae bacterium]|nr:phosphatase PAP2 family protein [Mycoplasmoidaceae bacterium]